MVPMLHINPRADLGPARFIVSLVRGYPDGTYQESEEH